MKPAKEKNVRDLLAKIIEDKKKYITEAMQFRQRMLQEKERTTHLRKAKSE